MDFIPQLLLLQDNEDEDLLLAALASLLLISIDEARRLRNACRNPSHRYLCRPQLLPSPRHNTPWQRLYASRDDRAFITTMGFNVETFHTLLVSGFEMEWEGLPIDRTDVSRAGAPRLHARSLDAAGALGLVLHYLSSAMQEVGLQQIFALIPATVSRYLKFSMPILLNSLRTMPEAEIRWPTGDEFHEDNALIVARHPRLLGAFGSADGLGLAVQEADDAEAENATYNGWKSSHFINNILAFSPQGVIIHATLNAPGSWHDAHTARPLFEKLYTSTPDNFYLVTDTAFPRSAVSIAGKIRAPLKTGQRVEGTAAEQDETLTFNRELLSYRQTAEWGMRAMQGGFARLRVPLDINDSEGRRALLELCCRLHNVRAVCIGINQIRSVYMPTWQAIEGKEIWSRLEILADE
ncbi:hypothetical protein OE88DRAFT_1808659, partial [Heliocybe sulcata]